MPESGNLFAGDDAKGIDGRLAPRGKTPVDPFGIVTCKQIT